MVAALASGTSEIRGALDADDTAAMIDCVRQLSAIVERDPTSGNLSVTGVGGHPDPGLQATPGRPVHLGARLSGTTSRFMLAACALGVGPFIVDGLAPLRARPMGGSIAALRQLAVTVDDSGGGLPITVSGGPARGGQVSVEGSESSQFLSGLAMAGPCMAEGLTLVVDGALVSRPYVDMTVAVMRHFGANVSVDGNEIIVAPGGYTATSFDVEPDASAASYFLAAAALCGGTVRVDGLGRNSLQGDVRFAEVLGRMGASVEVADGHVSVTGPAHGRLRGVVADLSAISDTAPTLGVVAAFASSATEVTGVGFIRHKETDRIAAVVTELQRLGVQARATADGFVIEPGPLRPAAVRTYDDHRMAMAFAVAGLASPGVVIVEPGCVDKTYPGFFADLDALRRR
jgi:3-phosphoshikimate 1-carboxyvinyltransferase